MTKFIGAFVALVVLAVAAAAGIVYSGLYNVAADNPHWGLTYRVLETLRTRSVERRAASVQLPANLADEKVILKGAGQYAAMCTSCHLAPGMKPTELSQGMYPAPPKLTEARVDPKVAYIAIKHGIKMSGMPAWGGPHGDEQVWTLVAFLAKLPELSPQEYQKMLQSPLANAAKAMASHGAATMPAGKSMEGMQGHPGTAEDRHGSGAAHHEPASPAK